MGKPRDGQRVNFSTLSIVRKCKELERQARIEALRDPLSKIVVTISCPLNHNMLWYNSLKSAPLLGTARFLALDRQLTSRWGLTRGRHKCSSRIDVNRLLNCVPMFLARTWWTDKLAGSPKRGDMIARNPKNYREQWLVAAQYFSDNFDPA